MVLPEMVVRRWREQVHAAAVAARAAAEAAAGAAAEAGVGARSLQLLHEPPANGVAPASLAGMRQRGRRNVDSASGTRAGLAHIDARPPDTAAALPLYVCRACEVFLPGDALDAHRACRWMNPFSSGAAVCVAP